MARRAGVTPFSLAAVNVESGHRSAPRSHIHFQPPNMGVRHITPPSPRTMYGSNPAAVNMPLHQLPRSETLGPPPPPPAAAHSLPAQAMQMARGRSSHGNSASTDQGKYQYIPAPAGPGLAPIQTHGMQHTPGPLPRLAELTTGVSPYGSPIDRPTSAHLHGLGKADLPVPASQSYGHMEAVGMKRRASMEMAQQDANYRRRMG